MKFKYRNLWKSFGSLSAIGLSSAIVISCGDDASKQTPVFSVNKTTKLAGSTIQGSGNSYTLSLSKKSNVTKEQIEALFSELSASTRANNLLFSWNPQFNADVAGKYTLTISDKNDASKKMTLVVTVLSQDQIAPVISVDKNRQLSGSEKVTESNSQFVIEMVQNSTTTKSEIEGLISVSDNVDSNLVASFAWTPEFDNSVLGTYTLNASAKDLSNNTKTITIIVNVVKPTVVDEEAPQIHVNENGALSGKESIVLSDSKYVIESSLGTSTTQVEIENLVSVTDNVDSDIVPQFSWSKTYNSNEAGIYDLVINALDKSANKAQTVTIRVNIVDNSKPIIVVNKQGTLGGNEVIASLSDEYSYEINLDQNSITTKEQIEALVSVSDTTDSSIKPTYKWNKLFDSAIVDTFQLLVSAVDSSGNQANVVTINVNVLDKTKPDIDLDFNRVLTGGERLIVGQNGNEINIAVNSLTSADDIEALISVTDNVDSNILPSFSWSPSRFISSQVGVYTLTITAIDSAKNEAETKIIKVYVTDAIAPTINVSKDSSLLSGGELILDSDGDYRISMLTNSSTTKEQIESLVSATDNVDATSALTLTKVWRDNSFSSTTEGDYLLTITAKDSNNNVSTATIRVNVATSDTEAPTINVNSSVNLSGGEYIEKIDATTYQIYIKHNSLTTAQEIISLFSATDNIDSSASITMTPSWGDNNYNSAVVGNYQLHLSATDHAQNTASIIANVYVIEDHEAPLISISTDGSKLSGRETIERNNESYSININKGSATTKKQIESLATVVDNIDKNVTLNYLWNQEYNASSVFAYVLTISATDSSQNQANAVTINVNVLDVVPPVIAIDKTGSALAGKELVSGSNNIYSIQISKNSSTTHGQIESLVSVTDDVDGPITPILSWGGKQFNSAVVDTYTLTINAQDQARNSAPEITITIKVVDVEPPVIRVNPQGNLSGGEKITGSGNNLDITINQGSTTTLDEIKSLVTVSDDTDTDLQPAFSWKDNKAFENTNSKGSYSLIVNATDSANNHAINVIINITVADIEPPEIRIDFESINVAHSNSEETEGGYSYTIPVNSVLTKAGIEAAVIVTDNIDSNINPQLQWDKTFNPSVVNTYTLNVVATDNSNNTSTLKLQIIVIDPPTLQFSSSSYLEDSTEYTVYGKNSNYEIAIKVNSNIDKSRIESWILAKDNKGNKINPTFSWDEGDSAFSTSQYNKTYVLTVNATDQSGNKADPLKLTIYIIRRDIVELEFDSLKFVNTFDKYSSLLHASEGINKYVVNIPTNQSVEFYQKFNREFFQSLIKVPWDIVNKTINYQWVTELPSTFGQESTTILRATASANSELDASPLELKINLMNPTEISAILIDQGVLKAKNMELFYSPISDTKYELFVDSSVTQNDIESIFSSSNSTTLEKTWQQPFNSQVAGSYSLRVVLPNSESSLVVEKLIKVTVQDSSNSAVININLEPTFSKLAIVKNTKTVYTLNILKNAASKQEIKDLITVDNKGFAQDSEYIWSKEFDQTQLGTYKLLFKTKSRDYSSTNYVILIVNVLEEFNSLPDFSVDIDTKLDNEHTLYQVSNPYPRHQYYYELHLNPDSTAVTFGQIQNLFSTDKDNVEIDFSWLESTSINETDSVVNTTITDRDYSFTLIFSTVNSITKKEISVQVTVFVLPTFSDIVVKKTFETPDIRLVNTEADQTLFSKTPKITYNPATNDGYDNLYFVLTDLDRDTVLNYKRVSSENLDSLVPKNYLSPGNYLITLYFKPYEYYQLGQSLNDNYFSNNSKIMQFKFTIEPPNVLPNYLNIGKIDYLTNQNNDVTEVIMKLHEFDPLLMEIARINVDSAVLDPSKYYLDNQNNLHLQVTANQKIEITIKPRKTGDKLLKIDPENIEFLEYKEGIIIAPELTTVATLPLVDSLTFNLTVPYFKVNTDQKIAGSKILGQGNNYTLTLPLAATTSSSEIEPMFSVFASANNNHSLAFTWDHALDTSTSGTYILTVKDREDVSKVMTLTVTVTDTMSQIPELIIDSDQVLPGGEKLTVINDYLYQFKWNDSRRTTMEDVERLFSKSNVAGSESSWTLDFKWYIVKQIRVSDLGAGPQFGTSDHVWIAEAYEDSAFRIGDRFILRAIIKSGDKNVSIPINIYVY